jgi:hypothetical protein
MRRTLKLTALFLFAGSAIASHAVVVMDQIGPDSSSLIGEFFTSQRFEAASAGNDVGAIDNFSVTSSQLVLTQVEAVVVGFTNTGPFTGFQNVQSWSVEVYSSVAAGATNLTGNVASVTLTPAQVSLNTAFAASIANSALITIPVTLTLPSAGTYWIAVIGRLDSANGQVGIAASNYVPGFPNGTNAEFINPAGGFQLPGNHDLVLDQNGRPVNLAYRVNAVPEPATMAALGMGAVALLARRRRKA